MKCQRRVGRRIRILLIWICCSSVLNSRFQLNEFSNSYLILLVKERIIDLNVTPEVTQVFGSNEKKLVS